MLTTTTYDVVIAGCGPIGSTLACTLKAIDHNLRICVVDKRNKPGRNHGLKINSDSVDKIQQLLQTTLDNQSPRASPESINILKVKFEGWRDNFIRTSQIEMDLTETAESMGVRVFRHKEFAITEENFSSLCESADHQIKNNPSSKLHEIFQNARVVIGADGSHSVVRKMAMKDQFSHQEVLRHLVELKYQTTGQMQPRGYKEASVDVIKHSRLAFETTSKDQSKPTKPVTLHLFVDKPTYESMRIEDNEGILKGVFGNSWSLSELEKLANTDHKIQRVYGQINDYLTGVLLRDGDCQNEQISTLELNVYKSANSVIKYNDKYVLLVGDAESGLVLERGFNKGLKGAAICAQAVSSYFQKENFIDEVMPESFVSYEKETLEIFESELRLAKIKNMALNTVETSLNGSRLVKETSSKISETSYNTSSKFLSSSKWRDGDDDDVDATSGCTLL